MLKKWPKCIAVLSNNDNHEKVKNTERHKRLGDTRDRGTQETERHKRQRDTRGRETQEAERHKRQRVTRDSET